MFIDTAMWFDAAINMLTAYALQYAYLQNYLEDVQTTALYFYLSFSIIVCLYFGLKRLCYYELFGVINAQKNYFSLWLTIVFAFVIPLFVLFLLKTSATVSRVWFLSWMCSVYLTLIATRHLWRWLFRISAESGYFSHKVVLVGSSGPLARASELLAAADHVHDIQLLSVCDLAQRPVDSTSGAGEDNVPQFTRMLNDCRDACDRRGHHRGAAE